MRGPRGLYEVYLHVSMNCYMDHGVHKCYADPSQQSEMFIYCYIIEAVQEDMAVVDA